MSELEIDVKAIFIKLWRNRFKIAVIVFVSVTLTGIFSKLATPTYRGYTTFFVNPPERQSAGLAGYASLLGRSNNSRLNGMMRNILGSYSLRVKLAEGALPYFADDIAKAISEGIIEDRHDRKVSFVLSKLKLHRKFNVSSNKDSMFKVTFMSPDPTLCKLVLDTTLQSILSFNLQLKLSADKSIITIVDEPRAPRGKFSPRLVLNLAVAFVASVFLSCLFFVVKDPLLRFYRDIKSA